MMSREEKLLEQIASNVLALDAMGKLVRLDNESFNRDKSLYLYDKETLRTMGGPFVRQARTFEWDATPDSMPYRFWTTSPLVDGEDVLSDAFLAVQDVLPPLYCLIMPDHNREDGVLVQPVWRGPALCAVRSHGSEMVWNCTQEQLKRLCQYMRGHRYRDDAAMDVFYFAAAMYAMWGDTPAKKWRVD